MAAFHLRFVAAPVKPQARKPSMAQPEETSSILRIGNYRHANFQPAFENAYLSKLEAEEDWLSQKPRAKSLLAITLRCEFLTGSSAVLSRACGRRCQLHRRWRQLHIISGIAIY